jgi:hypothetical protein
MIFHYLAFEYTCPHITSTSCNITDDALSVTCQKCLVELIAQLIVILRRNSK